MTIILSSSSVIPSFHINLLKSYDLNFKSNSPSNPNFSFVHCNIPQGLPSFSKNINPILKKTLASTLRFIARECMNSNDVLFGEDGSITYDWKDKQGENEDMGSPWEGAVVYQRNPSISHVEYCTTLERLGLGKLSTEVSRSRASVMGLRVTRAVKDFPLGTPVLISVDVTRKKKKLRLDGIVRTVITLACNRCGEPTAKCIFSNFSLLLTEEPVEEPDIINMGRKASFVFLYYYPHQLSLSCIPAIRFSTMDYLKTVVPSQLLAERGSNLVVINPGSANIRMGLAQQDTPFNIPHCIARRTTGANQAPKRNVQDQLLNSQVTTAQHMEREKSYDIIASLLKIPFLDEEVANNSFPRKMGRVDGYTNTPQSNRKETAFTWTNVFDKKSDSSSALESSPNNGEISEPPDQGEGTASKELTSSACKFREYIYGEEALRISPTEPYCLRRPIRRGHFNISQHYPMQQVFEDMQVIWDWILIEKLHIPHSERNMFSAILVVPETFDNREIKEMLSIVLRDLHFSSAVVHQEGLAAVFGNGLSTACVVNMGAQVTSVICIEDGVALPTTQMTLRFGGEDISRCLLWTQRHHQTWPPIRTDALTKPVDLLMLNRLKEMYCQIKEGEVEAVAVVHSYEDGMPAGSHKTRLTALNVPPMGLFYPMLLVPDVHPPPPRFWFNDYEDMLEDTWHMEFPRRSDMSDGLYSSVNGGFPMWDSYSFFQTKPKKEDCIGLAEAITKSILSTGRIDLQRKLFCSIQLFGGVALTAGLISAAEERVLHAIPSNEAIDTVEVLQSRTNPTFVSWKGGSILGVLDFGRDAWIHREDWIRSGIHIGSGRKYKDSYFLQAQAMCYMNS